MKKSEILRRVVVVALIAAVACSGFPLQAATLYWDADGTFVGNDVQGPGLGGSGVWNTTTPNWWNTTNFVNWPNGSADVAVFSGPSVSLPTANVVTLTPGVVANRLEFRRGGYTLSDGDLTLAGTSPTLFAGLGYSSVIESQILGSSGLTMTGGGSIRLSNLLNSYTGGTTISNGSLIITGQAALGLDTSAIVVNVLNPNPGNIANIKGFGGGSLVLDGRGGNITISRDLSLQGQGPIAERGAALVSTGVNTLSGVVDMGVAFNGTNLNTRIIAADGTLNITNTLNVLGTAGTTISSLGGVNQAGASFYNLTGVLTGTGTLESSGGGTLFLDPSSSAGFSGVIRVSGSAASGQSVVRIDSPNVLGTRTSTTTGSVLDMNGGILAVLMDTPSVLAGGAAANVYGRASSTFFADHTPNSTAKDQTVAFGQFAFEENATFTFNSRNGYGMSFGVAPVQGGNNNSTFTSNLQGGAQLTFTGNFWSNTENTAARTLTINGTGNMTINGSIIASSAAFDHVLTKSGTGTLTLLGTGSTLDGAVNIQNGILAISDWRAVTNNSATVNIGFNSGSTNTAGTLSIIGNNLLQANLTTAKVVNLAGTTGGATILANQTGTSPGVIFSSDFTATGAGTKTLTLGGTNTSANTINGAIVQNGTTNLVKIDRGRWILAGTNTYTGSTTISDGILQLRANAAASTILADTSAIIFNATNVYAGGTLEFIGQASANNVETLGALTPTNGSGTVKLTPGSGGTASIAFASLGTVGGGGTANLVAPTANDTFRFTTTSITNNIANAGLFFNGSDFAFVPGAGLVVRAPNYATDTDFATSATALTAARSNEVTGSFSTSGALAIDSLKISGDQTLTLGGNLTIRTAASSSASGGIIQTGGSGTITGNFIVGTNGSGTTVINVDGGANTLTLESRLASTGGLTKVGQGTLRLAGANSQTGTISINEGTIRLTTGGTLGGIGALTIRQDGILELNGITPTSEIAAFNNNGIVRNSSATTDVTFTVGNGSGTGTSFGIIENGGLAKVNVVKVGTGAQSWLGLSTYTGTTTIGSTGIVTINNLADGGFASGIGASGGAAGNLVFNGTSATQAYGGLSYSGTTNDETNRLFTFDGGVDGGVRIQSNGVNGATSTWTNTGALAFGPNAFGNPQGLVLGGSSTGDNRFFPIISDNGAAATSVYKADAGVWYLEAVNTYTGPTTIRGGALYVTTGTSLPTASNLVLDGGSIARTGAFTRTLGTGANQVQWTANASGGFSAGGAPLTVDWGAGAVWGTGPFIGTGALLLNNSGVAKAEVDILSGFEITLGAASSFNVTTTAGSSTVTLTSGTTAGLAIGQVITGNPNIPAGYTIATITGPTTFTLSSGTGVLAAPDVATNTIVGGYRQINVGDFTSIGADFGTISGVITGAGSLAKEGAGILNLRGANTYTGQTIVRQGTLVVTSLGNSNVPGASSLGDTAGANTAAGALLLGNGGTTAGILEYVGGGETSNRYIRLNTTTGNTQIHADGTGPLILTNVANDITAGAKTLFLRGVNAGGNMITSVLADNGGALGVTIDSSATWILTNANTYTGTTTVSGGALGIGNDSALGSSGTLSISGGAVFAFGGDRTIANPVTQSATSNTIAYFIGDYSLTFDGAWSDPSTTSSGRFIRNNIVTGKTLTINGAYTANAGTTSLGVGFDGSGDTIVNGAISTTMTNFGVTYAGTGSLTLGGANTYTGATTLTSGVLRLGADNVIPDGTGKGNLIINPALGFTAVFDVNGKTETVNGLTANGLGTTIIDNTSASAGSLIFGATDAAVSFGGGTGSFTITDSGAGALSITKTGATAAVIPTGVTLTYQGSTNVSGGSLTIASPVNGTTGLSAVNSGSTLALTGGITNPSAVTSVLVGNLATLNLLDGAGNKLTNLNNLQLGSAGGTLTTLNFNVGDLTAEGDELNTDTLGLIAGGTLSLFSGNQIRFNLTDLGLNQQQEYDLLTSASGGLSAGSYTLGSAPGGYSSIALTVTDTRVYITTGTIVTGVSYWRGATDTAWNASPNTWSQDKAGTVPATTIPGAGTDVIFAYNGVGTGPLVTTLEQNFKINSLTFEAGTTTPSSVTINPGVVATNRLEIAPQAAADGIKITAGGPASVTISGPVRLGGLATSQTWSVADAGSVLSLGSLLGERDVTKTGAGKVTLTAAADPTFNSGVTSDFVINQGTLEILNSAALGNTINGNLATVTINSTGAFYYNGTAGTVANALTLAGGTLSAGTANQIYSGTVAVSGASIINLRENNAATGTTARNITLSGGVGGSGKLTVDSSTTVTAGNQLSGSLTLTQNNGGWSGGVDLLRGTIAVSDVTALGTGAITAKFGRIQFLTAGGTTFNLAQNITLDGPGGVLELSADATGTPLSDLTVNLNGIVTIGSAANANNALRISQASDNFSVINFNGGIVLGNNASLTYQGSSVRPLVISSVISDGGSGYSLSVNDELGAWAVTSRTVRLLGLNTFSGNLSLGEGTLEFDTVTDAGGAASSLGQGNAISIGPSSAVLSFIGSTSQATNRPITTNAGVATLSANGTGGASITYNGAITVGPTGDGSQLVLTGTAGSVGVIAGGITETGDSADMTVNGGTWTHQTGTSRIGDDLVVTGASTIFNLNSGLLQVRDDFTVTTGATLNLNGAGVLSFNTATLSADASLRAVAGGTIALGASNAVVTTEFDSLRIGTDAAGVGTLNMNAFDLTAVEFILANRNADRFGVVEGTGVLTVTGNFDVYNGTIYAKLANSGTGTLDKISLGTVTLAGDNSGITSTGSTVVTEGTLILDYTTNNAAKLGVAAALDMRGSNLILNGNVGAATSQTVASFTLATGGSSVITLNPGTGQNIALNLNTITRAVNAQDGTVRFVLPSGVQSATNGITTDTLNTVGTGTAAILGAWATVNDGTGVYFARNVTNAADGYVGAAVTTTQDVVGLWTTGDNITDSAGFTGTVTGSVVNTLRFNAAGGSDIAITDTGVLGLAGGGILVTDLVGGTPSILGGTLASGAIASNVPELIITQESGATFEIDSDIRINHAVTKTGVGTLLLSGDNVYTGYTEIQSGTLQVGGGNGIGDTSLVTLSATRQSGLELLANETIGRLAGGSRATDQELGVVAVGDHTLTINNSGGNTTFSGLFTGTGNIIKQGTHNLNVNNLSSGFTGVLTIESGMLQLSNIGQINAGIIRINKGGNLLIDNNGTTRSATRILDTTPITLNSADGTFNGSTIIRGLAIRTDQNADTSETIGDLNFNTGANYLSGEGDVGSGTARANIIANNFVRNNNATFAARGRDLGAAAGERNQFKIGTSSNETAFIGTLVGGGGAAGSQNVSIIPWAIGAVNTGTNGTLTDNDVGNSLLTYVVGTGVRPLDFTTEYDTLTLAAATDNARESLGADLTGLVGKTVNALVVNNSAFAGLDVTGSGAGQTLTLTSGALLFTMTGGTASTAYDTTLGGFDGGIAVGGTEYVIHVVNPSSAATTSTLSAIIASPLTSAADITKSGRGTLVLSGLNTAGGGARTTTLNEGILEIADLDNIGGDVGSLVFAGGTLRFGATLLDDISLRTITLLDGGGTIDTNGLSLALANSVGGGIGGLTKTGSGNLTLNAAATYTGATFINAGTLTVGANNALGNGGAVTVNGGATLALGTRSITAGLVSTAGTSPLITGTGTINSSAGFAFNHTGDTAIEALLTGAGGLLKTQANILTLTGLNTYTGTTEVQGGTLVFNSIGNVNGGAGALGNPSTVENGIIRVGLSTAAVTLAYNGVGHTTNRLIALQGTTGRITLAADGSGAIDYAGGVTGMAFGAKTLALGGLSMSDVVNRLGAVRDGAATISLLLQGPNTWELTQANGYSGATSIDEGILILGAAQAMSGALNFGSANTIATAGVLDVRENSSFGSLTVQTDTISGSTLLIAADKTLTINGNVTIGTNRGAITNTAFYAQGEGTFVVNNPTGTTFGVGGYTSNTAGSGNLATADFSGLAAMQINLSPTSGIVRVNNTSGGNTNGIYAVLALARDTTITASQLAVGNGGQYNGAAGQVNQLKLGTGTTTINVGAVNIGTGSRDLGSITFQDSLSGTVKIRGVDGVGAAAFSMGTGTSVTAAQQSGNENLFDVSGHSADLLFSTMAIGLQNTRTGVLVNEFSFDTGKLIVQGALTMGSKTVAGDSTSTINIGGGEVSFGAVAGTSATLAANTSTGAVSAAINITGGTVDFAGHIVRGTKSGTGTATATITLNGGALNMNGARIGAAGAAGEVIFNAQSGKLSNLLELNGGAALTKTTAGSLVIAGTNAYTGATNVNQGVLTVDGAITGSGAVTVGSTTTAVLNGSGSIAGAVTVTSTGTFSAGSSTQQTTVSGNDGHGVGMLTLGSGLTWDAGSSLVFDFSGVDPIDGTSGAGTDWDFIDITGALSIGATPASKITLNIDSWVGDRSAYGVADGFDGQVPESYYPDASYKWLWATADGGINLSGDLSDYFDVNASRSGMGVPNVNPAGGTFWVSAIGNNLYINYSSVPEPGSLMLLGVAGLGFAAYRRRKAKRAADTGDKADEADAPASA